MHGHALRASLHLFWVLFLVLGLLSGFGSASGFGHLGDWIVGLLLNLVGVPVGLFCGVLRH
jgi:hypothetical protein